MLKHIPYEEAKAALSGFNRILWEIEETCAYVAGACSTTASMSSPDCVARLRAAQSHLSVSGWLQIQKYLTESRVAQTFLSACAAVRDHHHGDVDEFWHTTYLPTLTHEIAALMHAAASMRSRFKVSSARVVSVPVHNQLSCGICARINLKKIQMPTVVFFYLKKNKHTNLTHGAYSW